MGCLGVRREKARKMERRGGRFGGLCWRWGLRDISRVVCSKVDECQRK